jgi:hypothetical protein
MIPKCRKRLSFPHANEKKKKLKPANANGGKLAGLLPKAQEKATFSVYTHLLSSSIALHALSLVFLLVSPPHHLTLCLDS